MDKTEEEVKKEDPIVKQNAAQGVTSPYVPEIPPPTFDYDKYQDDTTIKACIEIFKCLGRNAENLVFNHDVDRDLIIDKLSAVAQEVMNIMIDNKVPDADTQKISDNFTQIPYQIFTIISRQKVEFEKELLARYIGVRDPGTGKYSREYAGLGDMFTALYKLRDTQGNNVEDYYTLAPKKEAE